MLTRLLEGASGHIQDLKQSLDTFNEISEDLLKNYRCVTWADDDRIEYEFQQSQKLTDKYSLLYLLEAVA